MKYENLTDKNFFIYAAQNYGNIFCADDKEFFQDLKIFKYIKKIVKKYKETGEVKINLLLNHIIILYNIFGNDPATRLLFLKFPNELDVIIPIISFLNYLPPVVFAINNNNIVTKDIQKDKIISDMMLTYKGTPL